MRTPSKTFDPIRKAIADYPIVDCHELMTVREKTTDVIKLLSSSYLASDLGSAIGMTAAERLQDVKLPVEERYPDFERAFAACRFTGYGSSVRRAMRKLFGSDEISRV